VRRRAVLAAAVLAAGCSSIPLATLWRLRSFGPEQLFALDPTQLRAAARVDARATMRSVTIGLDIEPADGSARRAYLIPLEQPAADPRLEPAPPGRRWYAFALSPEGLAEYRRIQREYAAVPKGSRGTVKISATDDGTVPADLKRAFPLRVDVLLDPAEGWITLISETKLDLSQSRKP
jgi:hypothetical protein